MSQNSEMMMQSKLAILNKKLERAGLGIVLTGAVDQTDDIFTVNSVERVDGEIVVKSQAQGTAAMCEQQIDAYVIDKLVAALQAALKDPGLNKRFADLGATTVAVERQNPDALGRFLKAEIDKWSPIIKKAGVYAD